MAPGRKNDPAAARERVLHAALDTVLHGGASGLTLEAVAGAAGISKGGLLHHFPNKNALALAMLHDLFARFNSRAEAYYAADAATPGRWMRAYIRAAFDDEPLPIEAVAMLAGSLTDTPDLLRAVTEEAQRWEARLHADGLTPARVRVLRGAADSVSVDTVIGLAALDAAERQAMIDELLSLVEVTP